MRSFYVLGTLFLVGLAACAKPNSSVTQQLAVIPATPRLLVLTDIGGDPDDAQALVRLLVMNNLFRIEGLVASASGTPGELNADVTRTDIILGHIDAYAQIYENLKQHAAGFASPEALRAVVKSGNPLRGHAHVGEGHDTQGSAWIIKQVDASTEPLAVAVWGGPTDLAQALYRVKQDRTPAELQTFVSRLRVHAIDHQDDSGPWIVNTFPNLFYVLNVVDATPRTQNGPKVDRRASVYRGMYLGGDETLTSRAWLNEHVRTGHGALGELYPDKTWTDPNPHGALKEGDAPAWFYFLRNGLQDSEQPSWGGWGGRFVHAEGQLYRDAQDKVDGVTSAHATVFRWRRAFQNTFAARMDWCVQPPAQANHEPQAAVDGDLSPTIVRRQAKAGSVVSLDASASRDPDGDHLFYRWWIYPEAGTNSGPSPDLGEDSASPVVALKIPPGAGGQQLHVILEVTDQGRPALTAYRRVVIDVAAGN